MCLAIPGRILSTRRDEAGLMARVSFAGAEREICIDFVPEAEVGDYVLVHVGFALSRIDPEEAERTLEELRRIGELT